MRRSSYSIISLILIAIIIIPTVNAQDRKGDGRESIPLKRKSINISSGLNSQPSSSHESRSIQWEVVYEDAPWIQVEFGQFDLGQRSFITIESRKDGAIQQLDATSIVQWRGRSAFFNSDALVVTLNIAPGDENVFMEIESLITEAAGRQDIFLNESTRTVKSSLQDGSPDLVSTLGVGGCDGEDDRIRIENPLGTQKAIGRLVLQTPDTLKTDCTGWLVSNGAVISAGHCIGNAVMIEFNVPLSNRGGIEGQAKFAHPSDQYPIEIISSRNQGYGKDWAVLRPYPNSNTGRVPALKQEFFFRLKKNVSTDATVRISGYGNDSTPAGPVAPNGTFKNLYTNTLQTDTGRYLYNFGTYHYVEVDISHGNSGSPMIDEGDGLAFGIQTHAGSIDDENYPGVVWDNRYCTNRGQSFTATDVSNAVNAFPGVAVTYVDAAHPYASSNSEGSMYQPFNVLSDAINSAQAGAVLSVVTGVYPGPFVINKALSIQAPVGPIILGGGPVPLLHSSAGGKSHDVIDSSHENVIQFTFELQQNYPNPATNTTFIPFSLSEETDIRLTLVDVLGRLVVSPVVGFREAGIHLIEIDLAHLASGVYVYQITTDRGSHSRRMIVLK